ncbi:sensor histidine kinase [Slackia exigua]|uniref:sensor histidine kinase n=1 Tax=Slackia exigua TaxID=84109 RepID=UPI00210AC53F|nr:HAMP domain-containing sensor histidine kinase [Slackia exigua]MCQ5091594.1 HAMP domain-containing histidine kinase [Slackia exigua]
METLVVILLAVAATSAVSAVLALHEERRQIEEIAEALADVRSGNGNRRLLADSGQLLSPLVYEINDIISAYEDRIATFRHAEEASKQLMTSLSHDVRTPLTTLIGYLDAVHAGIVTGTEREEYIETARRKAYGLKGYVDVLFDWFKLNSGDFTMEMQHVEATELTRGILIDWIPLLEDQRIEYSMDIPDEPVMVDAAPDGYMRIINNLMHNVITHSQASAMRVRLTKQDDAMRLSVTDNGIGIAKTDLKQIFSRLYTCDRSRNGKGSGLGLSIAYHLAENMNGRLDAESSLGRGTTFVLTLPLLAK